MVVSSVEGYETIYRIMSEIKAEAYKSGLFAFIDSDLEYNTPTVKLHIDHTKANDLGHLDAVDQQHIGGVDRPELCEPVQPERPLLSGHPADAAQ